MPTQAEFAARMRRLVRESQQLEGEALKRALELLREAHRDVLGRLASVPDGSFSRFQLEDLRRSMDRITADLERKLAGEIARLQAAQFGFGASSVDRAVELALGSTPSLGAVNPQLLGIAQDFSADLVGGLTADMRSRLNQALQRAVLGGQDLTEIIKEVGRSINSGAARGISKRALTITRTEILRMEGAAQQARLEQMKAAGLEVKKQWFHVAEPRPRPSHLEAHGAVVEVDEPFVIDGEELMYPRDPGASAEQTINCRCRLLPFVEGLSKAELSAPMELIGAA